MRLNVLIKEKETRVKFNPALSANRPSNNWALKFIYILFNLNLAKNKSIMWKKKKEFPMTCLIYRKVSSLTLPLSGLIKSTQQS